MGRSFSTSCSCRLIVCVETTAFFRFAHGKQDGRDQVGQALPDAGARFNSQVLAVLQRARDRHGHFLLLRAELEILRARQQAGRRKKASTWAAKSSPPGWGSITEIISSLSLDLRCAGRLPAKARNFEPPRPRCRNHPVSRGLRTTTSWLALFFTIMFAGNIPRQLTPG